MPFLFSQWEAGWGVSQLTNGRCRGALAWNRLVCKGFSYVYLYYFNDNGKCRVRVCLGCGLCTRVSVCVCVCAKQVSKYLCASKLCRVCCAFICSWVQNKFLLIKTAARDLNRLQDWGVARIYWRPSINQSPVCRTSTVVTVVVLATEKVNSF